MYAIGLDIGTTGCKAIIFDEAGRQFGASYDEFTVICDRPVWAEQSPWRVWQSVKKVIGEAVAQTVSSGVSKHDIAALSTSVLGEGIMPVDRRFQAQRNAILGMDYRAVDETDQLVRALGPRKIFDLTGFKPHPMASLPTIMWMRDHEPGLYADTHMYMTFTDYILMRLGAETPVIDWPQAGRTMLFDIEKKVWSQELLAASGFPSTMFSKPVAPGSIIGTISPSIAEELGLSQNVNLVAGGQDQTCAALGAGLTRPGPAMDSHGTVEGIAVVTMDKDTGEAAYNGSISCYAYTIPNRYFLMAGSQVGGLLMKWFRDNFSQLDILEAERTGRNVYDLMEEQASEGPAPVMVLPHFIGSGAPWSDLSSRGAIVGLSIDTTRHDIVKAIMDSLTCEFRINVDYFEQSGYPIEELRVVGGVSKSKKWLQIKADILNRSVSTLRVKEAACLGAAMIAMTAIGIFSSLEQAVAACVAVEDSYTPDPRMSRRYEGYYRKYTKLYDALKEFNRIPTDRE